MASYDILAGYRVTRDAKPISEILPTVNQAFAYLLDCQPQSTAWAMQYEGYAIIHDCAAVPNAAAPNLEREG